MPIRNWRISSTVTTEIDWKNTTTTSKFDENIAKPNFLTNFSFVFKNLLKICQQQTSRLVEAEKLIEPIRNQLRTNARELCDSQLRNFHQNLEDLGRKSNSFSLHFCRRSFFIQRFESINAREKSTTFETKHNVSE